MGIAKNFGPFLSRPVIIGNPFHGTVTNNTLALPNGGTKDGFRGGDGSYLFQVPGKLPVTRTPEQQADDTAKGFQWPNWAIVTRDKNVQYWYLYGGVGMGAANNYLYSLGEGNTWAVAPTITRAGSTIGGSVTVTRFGDLAGTQPAETYTLPLASIDPGQTANGFDPNGVLELHDVTSNGARACFMSQQFQYGYDHAGIRGNSNFKQAENIIELVLTGTPGVDLTAALVSALNTSAVTGSLSVTPGTPIAPLYIGVDVTRAETYTPSPTPGEPDYLSSILFTFTETTSATVPEFIAVYNGVRTDSVTITDRVIGAGYDTAGVLQLAKFSTSYSITMTSVAPTAGFYGGTCDFLYNEGESLPYQVNESLIAFTGGTGSYSYTFVETLTQSFTWGVHSESRVWSDTYLVDGSQITNHVSPTPLDPPPATPDPGFFYAQGRYMTYDIQLNISEDVLIDAAPVYSFADVISQTSNVQVTAPGEPDYFGAYIYSDDGASDQFVTGMGNLQFNTEPNPWDLDNYGTSFATTPIGRNLVSMGVRGVFDKHLGHYGGALYADRNINDFELYLNNLWFSNESPITNAIELDRNIRVFDV